MSETAPNPYSGLDQLIAKPTRAETSPVQSPQENDAERVIPSQSRHQAEDLQKKRTPEPNADTNLVRRLDPDPPDTLELYRKQTIYFGPKEIEAILRLQAAMTDVHDQEISKIDIVRAAIELLLKDFELHKADSFFVRKFVRR